MSQNPIKSLRESNSLTQAALASICGTTMQVIQKLEMGLYTTIPPSVGRTAKLLGVDNIEADYELWIRASLKGIKLPVGSSTLILDHITFIEWKDAFCGLNKISNTTYGFCKLMKIHPYVIEKYEAGKLRSCPIDLIRRVIEIKGGE